MAAQNGHTEVCTLLLGHNAHVNQKWGDGTTSLFMAVQDGHASLCTVLFKRKRENWHNATIYGSSERFFWGMCCVT